METCVCAWFVLHFEPNSQNFFDTPLVPFDAFVVLVEMSWETVSVTCNTEDQKIVHTELLQPTPEDSKAQQI